MSEMLRKDYVGGISILNIALVSAIAGDTVTINGLTYTGVAGVKSDATEFSIDTSNGATAIDLALSINADVRTGTVAGASLSATSIDDRVVINCSTVVRASSSDAATIGLSGSTSTLLSLTSNISDNNETFKRVNFMNTPYSVQSSGVDKEIWKDSSKRLNPVRTEAEFNTITTRTRVLWGNREGYIKSFVASTSLVFTWLDQTKTEVDTTKTMAQVIASGSLFILVEKY